jgi:hypothetical protein
LTGSRPGAALADRAGMRLAHVVLALIAAAPQIACTGEDDGTDLGTVSDGKGDVPAIQDVPVTLPRKSTNGNPGVRNFYVTSSAAFAVTLTYDGDNQTRIIVTNQDDDTKTETALTVRPTLTVSTTADHRFKIRLENWATSTTYAKLSVLPAGASVSPELLAAARANLDRISREIDYTHLRNYGLSGSNTDQFLEALRVEYATQEPALYAARVRALASMAFFALPDVRPPTEGLTTPFHGLDMDQFSLLASVEDQIFDALVSENGGGQGGVRPFSVCETRYIIETYVRPRAPFPGFAAHRAGYTTHAASCPQKDKDEWYNFRGLGGLRPSWVESNLADRFLRRMAKHCQAPSAQWASECAVWNADRFDYRQGRSRQLAARTMFYAPEDEGYLVNPGNSLVLLEDRNQDGIGEFLRPGPVTLTSGEQGTLIVTSTGQFTGNLKFQGATGSPRTVKPQDLVAESRVDASWDPALLADPDMGLLSIFSDDTSCTGATLDPAACPLMQRFYSMIDRHENFYQTYSALTPDYYGISSQPSPLVACSITLAAAHSWDTAGTPSGGTAGFIFLMRIPFKDILAGSDTSVATVMPGPDVTSIQDLYRGDGELDMTSAWLDIATLSNNLYAEEHEISAFGAVPAHQIEGILVIRKPAAVP